MRILVTRPQPAASTTANRLSAMGHEPLLLPLMQAVHDPHAVADCLAKPHATIALTSAEAARALSAVPGGIDTHFDTPVFCVGTATAEAASKLGFRTILTGPGNGEGLAKYIAASSPEKNAGLLYLAGEPRSADFEAGLHREGIRFKTVAVYRMVPTQGADIQLQAILETGAPEVILFYSRETARRFFELPAASGMKDTRFLCLSAAVAEALPKTAGPVAIAGTPNEDGLLSLL